MDDEYVSYVREIFPESELWAVGGGADGWWVTDPRPVRWLMDGAVESLRCRHMSPGSEYMNGPAPRVTLGISGENNWSHRHYHTTPHDATYDSLHSPTSSAAQRSVVCRVAPVQVKSPTAASLVFAKLVCLYCIVYMIVAMCLCMVRCVVLQWSRKCGCSCCQFRKLQIVTVVVSINFEKPDRI